MEITDHDGKETILWNTFKGRMGLSKKPTMLFDLNRLLQGFQGLDLSAFAIAFTNEEIEHVVKNLPNEKSSGPDGFNNEFMKACWDIIGPDCKQLVNDFFEVKVNLESINSSYITLIPKISSPTGPNDYRPISLLNSVLKIITKLLASRLLSIILKMVHQN